MLSILIPVYNYDISELLTVLHQQVSAINIPFEIIIKDDASVKYVEENTAIAKQLKHTTFIRSTRNIGRTATRQFLSEKAKYGWLLFLDADVIPKKESFIIDYISKIDSGYQCFFGGFAYNQSTPNHNNLLRWKYGKMYEEIDAKKRNLNPFKIVISANLFIQKSVFQNINPHLDRKSYGLDNYFSALLKKNQIKVLHLNNEVYHYGLETNTKYLEKAEEAIQTILWLQNNLQIPKNNSTLLKTHLLLKRFKLHYLTANLYKLFYKSLKKNLIGKNPNVKLLQLYKLFYIGYKDLDH